MKNKGITLIALIITIIVLLILAGITISTLRASGLFEKAIEAKEISQNAQNLENQTLSNYEQQIDELEAQDRIAEQDKIDGAHYLYYKGIECKDRGGEWQNNPLCSESSIATLEKNENSMTYTAGIALDYNPDYYPVCTKTETMDISEYDEINAEIEILEENTGAQNRNVCIQILDNKGNLMNNYIIPSLPTAGSGEKITVTYEITDLPNLENVYFGIANYGYKVKIHSINLKKYKRDILELYNAGNEYTDIGGQWINNEALSSEYAKGPLTKNSDYMSMQIKETLYSNPICTKEELLDITEYDTLNAEVENISTAGNQYRNIGLKVFNKSGKSLKETETIGPLWGFKDDLNIKKKISLDISDIQDTQTYFGVCGNGYTINIYRIWLEKITK